MVDSGLITQVDYTSRDFSGYRESLLTYATQIIPEWTSRSPADFGVALVEMFAYLGDIVSYYQDRIVDESFLATATQRSSVVALARQLGYEPHPALPSTGYLTLSPMPEQTRSVTVPVGTKVITGFIDALDRPLIFETVEKVLVSAVAGTEVLARVAEGRTQGSRVLALYAETEEVAGVNVLVEDVGVSSGRQGQDFSLAQGPVLLDTVRVFVDDGVGGEEWVRVDDFLLQEGDAKIFTTFTDDLGTTHILFGDNADGQAPASGLRICAAYRTGGGAYGNIGAGRIRDWYEPVPGVQIAGSSAMAGGADEESLEQIRVNAPRLFRTMGRAVTEDDYAGLALAVPGIADARAVAVSAASVTIFVVGPNNTLPTQAQRDKVANYVKQFALSGVTVTVANGVLVKVDFAVKGNTATTLILQVLSRYRRETVRLAVEKALQKAFAPSATTFGSRVAISQIYQKIQAVPGVDWSLVQLMRRADVSATGTADVVCKEFEIPVLGVVEISAAGGV